MNGTGVSRRDVLGAMAGAGATGLAGCGLLPRTEDAPTVALDAERARTLASTYAPSLYFDRHERWFPTDPRPYVQERDGGRVVDGFEAFNDYSDRFDDLSDPPRPVAFYNAVGYRDSPLAAVQFWFYSVFDQFTTNFHWHDWEVLHVFVDTEAEAPQLYVASSHSRKVPNNEFLDPGNRPRILTELGSHSSALSVNEVAAQFERLPLSNDIADITNDAITGLDIIQELPLAYGLPRDEGSRLPYLVPELDGQPIYEDERLPAVTRDHLVDEALTIQSFADLADPPTDLPKRETGVRWEHAGREEPDSDVEYELSPASELESIETFAGPQLSFQFAIPQFAEDAIAHHIRTAGIPWDQQRYRNPAVDITDPRHRNTLASRYDAIGEVGTPTAIVAAVSQIVPEPDAPEGEGLTTDSSDVEALALLESDPAAVPTFRGVAAFLGVSEGDHRLSVNRAGSAPHSEVVSAQAASTTPAGVSGEIPLVANNDAIKLGVDPRDAPAELTRLTVGDDFAGPLYDAPLRGPDAVYVHRGGALTAEVRDADDAIGAYRVTPTEDRVRIAEPRTGMASLADYIAAVADETRRDVSELDSDDSDDRGETGSGPIEGLAQALQALNEAARAAADHARAGNREVAEERLSAVATRLERVGNRLETARSDLPTTWNRAVARRVAIADRRLQQARSAEKL